jgi:Putative metal-binding motif
MRRTRRFSRLILLVLPGVILGAACATGSDAPEASSGGTSGPGATSSATGTGGSGGAGGGQTSSGVGGGDVLCDEEGATEPCYGGNPLHEGIGACVLGTHTCESSGEFLIWSECTGWGEPSAETCDGIDNDCNGTMDEGCCVPSPEICDGLDNDCNGTPDEGCCVPSPEICDGLDNDCNGFADDGAGCGPGSCGGGPGPCFDVVIPPPQPLVSGCAQNFPPAQGLACPIANPGTQYYVSAASGNDTNDGLTPATAWATLCYAVTAAPAGSTIQVAEGDYASAHVYVGKELTVKGGYDANFAAWDPDLYPSVFYGRLTLDHNASVFGGFRMIGNPVVADNWSYGHHYVGAGTLVRNYIEIVVVDGVDPLVLNLYGIIASACPGGVTVLRCNDVYVRSSAPQGFVVSAIEYGNQALHAGHGVLDANRVCQDGGGGATGAIGGYGSCFPNPVSLLLRNNVIEKAGFGGGGSAMNFYNCGSDDMTFVLTNNTFLSSGDGLIGSGDPPFLMNWKLTNNIVFSMNNGSSGVNLGGAGVAVTTSEGNLVFGFNNNGILPVPLMSGGDDTSDVATPISVFMNAALGDLELKPAGQGAGTGLNVHALPAYGDVVTDIVQAPRPMVGPWDRGAYGL